MKHHNHVNRLHAVNGWSYPRLERYPGGTPPAQARAVRCASSGNAHTTVGRSVLVLLDGSSQAEQALPYALAIAQQRDTIVHVVHIPSRFDPMGLGPTHSRSATNGRGERDRQDYLSTVVDRFDRTDFVTVKADCISGPDAEDLFVKASERADLVVMSYLRRGLLRQFWYCSMADRLRRRLFTPVLLVHSNPSSADLNVDPIGRHILIPLDGSAFAERILAPAMAMSQREGARVSLLNVQNPAWTNGPFEHTTPPGYLIGVANDLEKAIPAVSAHVMTTDRSLASAIASFAERRKVDLIALATHSDGAWARLLRGSVAESLIRQTKLPLLLLRIDKEPQRPEITTVIE